MDWNWKSILFAAVIVCLVATCTCAAIPRKKHRPQAQYVRLSRHQPMLEIAEVQVYDDADLNVAALYGKARQSSLYGNVVENGPMNALNGNTSGHKDRGELARTSPSDPQPFWEVQLPSNTTVKKICVFLRDHDHFPNPESEFLPKNNQKIHVELLCPKRKVIWSSMITFWQPMFEFKIL